MAPEVESRRMIGRLWSLGDFFDKCAIATNVIYSARVPEITQLIPGYQVWQKLYVVAVRMAEDHMLVRCEIGVL